MKIKIIEKLLKIVLGIKIVSGITPVPIILIMSSLLIKKIKKFKGECL